jgi:1,2-dihydroxy-3-keto-5-methylthiopentene dioxygenase
MSRLRSYEHADSLQPRMDTADRAAIESALGRSGIRFEQWRASVPLAPSAGEPEICGAYRADIDRLKAEGGYRSVDVVRVAHDHPDKVAIRRKFLSEHTHAEDEVRFFVEGSGLFSLHIGDSVHLVTCERGDLLGVPAGTRHWFDMGENPLFSVIRLFTDPSGWVAQYTGDPIAERFPKHD